MDRRSFVAGLTAVPMASLPTVHAASAQTSKASSVEVDLTKIRAIDLRYAPQFEFSTPHGKPANVIDFYWSPGCKGSMFTAATTIADLVQFVGKRNCLFRFTTIPRTKAELLLVAAMIRTMPNSFGPLCMKIFLEAASKSSGLLSNDEIAEVIKRYPIDKSADLALCKISAIGAVEYFRSVLGEAVTPAIYVNAKRLLFNPAISSAATVVQMLS
jgi:hypothetical protein